MKKSNDSKFTHDRMTTRKLTANEKDKPHQKDLPALPPSDFRVGRCAYTKDMKDPANNHEQVCWDEDGLHPYKDAKSKDHEDSLGYYALFGCTKSSSDDAIHIVFNKAKQRYHHISLNHHPDKTKDDMILVVMYDVRILLKCKNL